MANLLVVEPHRLQEVPFDRHELVDGSIQVAGRHWGRRIGDRPVPIQSVRPSVLYIVIPVGLMFRG